MGIYSDNKSFNDIKSRFEGKRVLKVEQATSAEGGIAKFHMDNGAVFNLCANDLGYWTTDAAGADGLCKSLTTWFNEYHDHVFHVPTWDITPAIAKADSNTITILTLIANDGECFNLDVSALSEKEQDFVNSTDLNDLAQLAIMGDCWMMGVDDIDGELVIKDNWKAGWSVDS